MKIPEPFFVLINPMMRILLSSPLHFLVSRNVLLIKYRGRKSNRPYTIPVRYMTVGDTIKVFTREINKWWPNLKDNDSVILRVRGKDRTYRTTLTYRDPQAVREELVKYFERYPADTAYYDVKLEKNRVPRAADLDQAATFSVIVTAAPI